eukprot:TRINITY_DN1480_c0_g2_i6.p2 TRINITY_DN1480_c0_g2~~TRINITY_DN1480_c0_g2_i6.p2  ORF type:complete len:642 (+),score=181.58 TRINITY_DN1480_c0_g2_i6:16-1941(+)
MYLSCLLSSQCPPARLGMTPRVLDALYRRLSGSSEWGSNAPDDAIVKWHVHVSFFEIYRERIIDLLNDTRQKEGSADLRVRWSKKKSFYVENLFSFECGSAAEAMSHYQFGLQQKAVSAHRLNAHSSRSHCIFEIRVSQEIIRKGETVSRVKSRLLMVDLAGSERLTMIGGDSKTEAESIEINRSLFALGKVITALSKPRKGTAGKSVHVPYRDSKLTRVLKDALGGNSLSVMIACVAPSDAYYEENLNTLQYAARAKSIHNVPIVNEDPRIMQIRMLTEEVNILRKELEAYRLGGSVYAGPHGLVPVDGTDGVDSEGIGVGMGPWEPGQSFSGRKMEKSDEDDPLMIVSAMQSLESVKELAERNRQLRSAFDRVSCRKGELEHECEALLDENDRLRDKLDILHNMLGIPVGTEIGDWTEIEKEEEESGDEKDEDENGPVHQWHSSGTPEPQISLSPASSSLPLKHRRGKNPVASSTSLMHSRATPSRRQQQQFHRKSDTALWRRREGGKDGRTEKKATMVKQLVLSESGHDQHDVPVFPPVMDDDDHPSGGVLWASHAMMKTPKGRTTWSMRSAPSSDSRLSGVSKLLSNIQRSGGRRTLGYERSRFGVSEDDESMSITIRHPLYPSEVMSVPRGRKIKN